jgi:hypothetical protein
MAHEPARDEHNESLLEGPVILPLTRASRIARPLTAVALLVPVLAFAIEPQEIAKRAFPSVVLLIMKDSHGQPLSLGSGFVVRNNVIATNFHVIRGAGSGSAKIIGQSTVANLEGVFAVDEIHDLALIKATLNAPPLAMTEDKEPEIGETVFAVGNPEGLEGTFSQGIVSGIRGTPEGRWLQITAPISPGSSGGPVLNAKGEVLGVAVATLKSGQNLNFAIPVKSLNQLLAMPGSTRPFWAIGSPETQRPAGKPTKPPTHSTQADESPKTDDGSLIRNGLYIHSEVIEERSLGPGYLVGFSVKNNLNSPVTLIKLVAIFYTKAGEPLDYGVINLGHVMVPPGAAIRGHGKDVDETTKMLTSRIEFRVLDFLVLSAQTRCSFVKITLQYWIDSWKRLSQPKTSGEICSEYLYMLDPDISGITDEQCRACLE